MKKTAIIALMIILLSFVLGVTASSAGVLLNPGQFPYPESFVEYMAEGCFIGAYAQNMMEAGSEGYSYLLIRADQPSVTENSADYLSVSQKNYLMVDIEGMGQGSLKPTQISWSGRIAGLFTGTANPYFALVMIELDDASLQAEAGGSYEAVASDLLNSGWFMPPSKGKWVGQCMAFASVPD